MAKRNLTKTYSLGLASALVGILTFVSSVCGQTFGSGRLHAADRALETAQLGAKRESSNLSASPRAKSLEPPKSATISGGKTSANDVLGKNVFGVQTRYPAIAKIIGRTTATDREDGKQSIPLYYGTGAYVAEYGAWGIVVTNWHVVSEANESIDVIFPSGSTPARIILKDSKWDLAALLVRKPTNVSPLPISLDVPKIGETLWATGYGPSGGLSEFRILPGRLANYVSLEVPKESLPESERALAKSEPTKPLYETLSIDVGVRRGDSGGPILNRYGEVSGVLWGSDGSCTMATNGVRLQTFVTQAVRGAARLRARKMLDSQKNGSSPDDVVPWDPDRNYPDALMSDLPMVDAVLIEGVFPSSTRPLYYPGNGVDAPQALRRLDKSVALKRVRDVAQEYWKNSPIQLPPSPPIFSPTFVVQQRQTNQDRPELIENASFDELDKVAMNNVLKEQEIVLTRSLDSRAPHWSEASFEKEDDAQDEERADASSKYATASTSPNVAERADQTAPERSLSTYEAYGVACSFIFVFYFAARCLASSDDGSTRRRKKAKKVACVNNNK